MTIFSFPEEATVLWHFCDLLGDKQSAELIQCARLNSAEEARHLSQLFWKMIDYSANNKVSLPVEGGSEFWLEKIYNSLGGFIEQQGYGDIWQEEVDRA